MNLDSTTIGVISLIIVGLFVAVFISWSNTREARRHTRQIYQQQKLVKSSHDAHRLSQAIHLLHPTARIGTDYTIELEGPGGTPHIASWEAGGAKPEQAELDRALAQVPEVDTRGYAAMRRAEYPSVEDQLDAAWKARHGNDTEQLELDRRIEEIKNKYPRSDAEL